MMQSAPLVLIQWKEVFALIIAFCGAMTALGVFWFKLYKVAAKAFGLAVDMHLKPLSESFGEKIDGLTEELRAHRMANDESIRDIAQQQELQAADISELGRRADEHDDELEEHKIRLAVLEKGQSFTPINPVQGQR